MTRDELRALPLFAAVSDACLDRVPAVCGELEAPAGAVLALTGDVGSGMFVVLEGRVTADLRDGPVELGPGEFFGELPLLVPDAGRAGRVRAATDVRCLTIPRDELMPLLESEPSFAIEMLRVLARRLLDANTPG